MARKKNHTDPGTLLSEMEKSLQNLKNGIPKEEALTKRALELIYKQVKKTLLKKRYDNRQDYEDCIQSAMLDILMYWDRFDPDAVRSKGKVPNAFAYFSTCIFTGGTKGWNELHPKRYKGTLSINNAIDGEGIYTI